MPRLVRTHRGPPCRSVPDALRTLQGSALGPIHPPWRMRDRVGQGVKWCDRASKPRDRRGPRGRAPPRSAYRSPIAPGPPRGHHVYRTTQWPPTPGPGSRSQHLTVAERTARGPRRARRGPAVAATRASTAAPATGPGRAARAPGRRPGCPELVPIRYGRMLVSPFAFYPRARR